jgi:ubiquinone/menaquinone biosynthesis C-methylase UbiE
LAERNQEALAAAYQSIWTTYLSQENLRQTIETHRVQRRLLLELLRKYVVLAGGPRARVLEIGCGTGIDSYILAEATEAKVFGSDLLPESVALAHKLSTEFARDVEFFVDDACAMNVPDSSFDVVFSQGVVEHFSDPTAIMSEQTRIVRPGGYVVVDVPQTFSLYTLTKKREIRRGTWPFGWETQYSYRSLSALGRRFGLVPVDRAGYGFDPRRDLLGYLRVLHHGLRHTPLRDTGLARRMETMCEAVWRRVENTFGHRFLINVVVVFQKPEPV